MIAKTFQQLIDNALVNVEEVFPWDLEETLAQYASTAILLDIREIEEYNGAHIANVIHVPRGILETACDWGYADTIPELVNARQKVVVVICRSGNRSVLAAQTLQFMGYENVFSLRTGVKGWNDAELPLINQHHEIVDPDWAEQFLSPSVRDDQLKPN